MTRIVAPALVIVMSSCNNNAGINDQGNDTSRRSADSEVNYVMENNVNQAPPKKPVLDSVKRQNEVNLIAVDTMADPSMTDTTRK